MSPGTPPPSPDPKGNAGGRPPHGAEDTYLTAIYLLAEEGTIAPPQARLAERLGYSGPAVSEMIRRLQSAGLVTLDRRSVILTPTGTARAEAVIRKHRLVERLLTDVIGLDWTSAHHEADQWAPVVSEEVEHLLIDFLGRPTTSSLGTPIPGAVNTDPDTQPLLDAQPGQKARIAKLSESLQADRETIRYLADHGLSPGATLTVESRSPDGTITLRSSQASLAVSPTVARQIHITYVDERESPSPATKANVPARRRR
jgi:DtxR family transcriptional regulator, Mn-dependent transcriptional regulator